MSNPPNFSVEDCWKNIKLGIQHICNRDFEEINYRELYRSASEMVRNDYCEKFYYGLKEIIEDHLKTVAESIQEYQEDSFLDQLVAKWNYNNMTVGLMRGLVIPIEMDTWFISRTNKSPFHEMGIELWRDFVIHSHQIQPRLSSTILEFVHSERTGQVISRGLLRNIINMLLDSKTYGEDFEQPFLQASTHFYGLLSQQYIERCDSCADYLENVERLLKEEADRVSNYLHSDTQPKIANVVHKEMLANHVCRLVRMENSGLVKMLLDDDHRSQQDLARMYNLFRRDSDSLAKIKDVMMSHIKDTGRQFVNNPENSKNPVEFVQSLLEQRDKYDDIISSAFANDDNFNNALRCSFEHFVNLHHRSPEYVSLFVHDKLRRGLADEAVLDKVMKLFRCLREKDVFKKYYTQHLAERLLYRNAVSDDEETSVIVKLKTECGSLFTSNLERMFSDMKTSQDTKQGFYAACGAELGNGLAFDVRVLTTGSWPTPSTNTCCKLPDEVSLYCEKFQSYYLSTYKGRRLTWHTGMGTADLRATFGNGSEYDLDVWTYQMCVLVLFNNTDHLSFREIEQATGIPSSDLKRCLQSLACVKGKNVLCKDPMSKEIGVDDAFSVNDYFTSKLRKVNLRMKCEQDDQEKRQKVEEDRSPQMDAAIIRIMKSRKELNHNNIIAEVTKQLQSNFQAQPRDIKKRIESLIEREYLERDDKNRQLYKYLA